MCPKQLNIFDLYQLNPTNSAQPISAVPASTNATTSKSSNGTLWFTFGTIAIISIVLLVNKNIQKKRHQDQE